MAQLGGDSKHEGSMLQGVTGPSILGLGDEGGATKVQVSGPSAEDSGGSHSVGHRRDCYRMG